MDGGLAYDPNAPSADLAAALRAADAAQGGGSGAAGGVQQPVHNLAQSAEEKRLKSQ